MAASCIKLIPSSLSLAFKNVRPLRRPVCSCKNSFVLNQSIKESLNVKSLSRCLSTSAKCWNEKKENEFTEPVTQEVDDDLDVLYKKLIVEVKGHDRAVLKSYTKFIKLVSKHLKLNLRRVSTPPMYIHRQSVLKSVHIFKKHQVQYEERTYFEVYLFKHMTGSTVDTFLEYIQRNLPEGVGMKVTKHRVEKLPEHIKPPINQQAQIEHSTS